VPAVGDKHQKEWGAARGQSDYNNLSTNTLPESNSLKKWPKSHADAQNQGNSPFLVNGSASYGVMMKSQGETLLPTFEKEQQLSGAFSTIYALNPEPISGILRSDRQQHQGWSGNQAFGY